MNTVGFTKEVVDISFNDANNGIINYKLQTMIRLMIGIGLINYNGQKLDIIFNDSNIGINYDE